MKIGILGSGAVGQALASGFIQYGDEAMIGTRNPGKLADWRAQAGKKAHVGSVAEAAAFGELVVLATKGTVALDTLQTAGNGSLDGKTVIDATNPIADAPPENGVLKFFTSLDSSLMEQLQAAFPKARFVKAFNSIGSAHMVDPDFGGIKPTMCICGNDANAKDQVSGILQRFGFEVSDLGGVQAARAIEPLCILWCIPGFLHGEWMHAFKILKK